MQEGLIRPVACLAMLLLVGCARTVTVDVKGTQKTETPIPPHVTYAVLPTSEVEKDAAFLEYSKLIARELENRGYRQTDPKAARLGVYLAYGVRKLSATSDSSPSLSQSMGSAGGATPGSGPSSMTGSSPSMGSAPVYLTHLVVVVTDQAQSQSVGSLVELWRGETLTRGGSQDLPRLAPLLIEAVFRHFGQSTPNPVQHAFGEDDVKKLQAPR